MPLLQQIQTDELYFNILQLMISYELPDIMAPLGTVTFLTISFLFRH